jgi:hypothetical protein
MVGSSGFGGQCKKVVRDSVLSDESKVLGRTNNVVETFQLSFGDWNFLDLDIFRGWSLVTSSGRGLFLLGVRNIGFKELMEVGKGLL